jgi:nucleoid-associated protein YgaU
MVNPLRLPAVLVTVFTLMFLYVHAYHRRHHEGAETTVPLRDHLQLRQPAGQMRASSYRGGSTADDEADASSDVSSRRDDGFTDDTVRSLPLPAATSSAGAETVPASPRATLLGPVWPDASTPPPADAPPHVPAPAPLITDAGEGRAVPDQRHYTPDAPHPSATVMHRIVDGDTLPRLAERYLGDPSRYPEILANNPDVLVQPDLLPLGVRIRIPVR